MFGIFKKKGSPPPPSIPVPKWQPAIAQPLDVIAERVAFYTNGKRDFVVFQHGTCVLVSPGLSAASAAEEAQATLSKIFNCHPDMNPVAMKDGNITVQYHQPALNVVLDSMTKAHWPEIERRHQDALATSEVLMTPLGANKFDDFGKKALFGRCFMFMDAQNPVVVRLVRAVA
jgi:hypothetical protein